jgi:hypothetical protein
MKPASVGDAQPPALPSSWGSGTLRPWSTVNNLRVLLYEAGTPCCLPQGLSRSCAEFPDNSAHVCFSCRHEKHAKHVFSSEPMSMVGLARPRRATVFDALQSRGTSGWLLFRAGSRRGTQRGACSAHAPSFCSRGSTWAYALSARNTGKLFERSRYAAVAFIARPVPSMYSCACIGFSI